MKKLAWIGVLGFLLSACGGPMGDAPLPPPAKASSPGQTTPPANPDDDQDEGGTPPTLEGWRIASETVERANTAASFRALQRKYQHLSRFNAKEVSGAEIHVTILQFVKKTRCAKNDPRLTWESIAYSVCFQGDEANCQDSVTAYPSDTDPCRVY